jgi:hypothetical protein
MDLKTLVDEYIALNLSGKAMDAFEKYYADDVVMQENELPPTVGKEANRKREHEFFANVSEFRGAEVKAVTVGDGVAMMEWFYDYTHNEWGERSYHQVAVQRWRDGKIIHERFYYGC